MTYSKHYNARVTPQSEAIPGKDMVPNSAGGFAFQVDDWARLQRFLILGAEGGTYYIGEKTLTVENAEAVLRCIKENGLKVVNTVVDISKAGRAPKNDPALFVLATCAGLGDNDTRSYALSVLPQVARIGTHLFHFAEYVQAFRGWGRALRRAVAEWYTSKDAGKLAYQLVKYQQRDGWSHRDLLRLSHPKGNFAQNELFGWVTQGELPGIDVGIDPADDARVFIHAFERAKTADEADTIKLISDYGLTREMVQTQHLNSPAVWEALLEKMPMTAMIRNLGKMTSIGLIKPLSKNSQKIVERLGDEDRLRKARVHPLNVLVALKTYNQGHGMRGNLSWSTDQDIVDALDGAFYKAFGLIEPTNKRFVLGVDVSGSMGCQINNMPLTAAEAAAAMAMVTRRTEAQAVIRGFSGTYHRGWSMYSSGGGMNPRSEEDFMDLKIGRNDRLDNVLRKTDDMNFGRTDCALPMLWATKNGIEADVFIIYTDNETWEGNIHASQALVQYRERMGIPAKLIVVGMVSNGFSIADPNDGGMLDVVGFDTSIPNVMKGFIEVDAGW